MNENILKELDNEALVDLLQSLEQLDDECKTIIDEMDGENNE